MNLYVEYQNINVIKRIKKPYTWSVLGRVILNDSIIKPHMRHCHTILGKSTRFVAADGRGRTECLYGFQVFYQTVLLSHSGSSQIQADSNCG